MKYKATKDTPVWVNNKTKEVVCGETVQEALGIPKFFPVSKRWERATILPDECRVCISSNGTILPDNELNRAIASKAKYVGPLTVYHLGNPVLVRIAYVDAVKVVYGREQKEV